MLALPYYNVQHQVFFAANEGRAADLRNLIRDAEQRDEDTRAIVNYIHQGSTFTPLHRAAMQGHAECVKILVEAGADTEAQDFHNNTPLQWAAWHCHSDCVEALIIGGAKLEPVDDDGDTALSSAASAGSQVCAEILLVHGANVNHVNNARQTPLAYALEDEHMEVAGLLISYGATLSTADKSNRELLETAARHAAVAAASVSSAVDSAGQAMHAAAEAALAELAGGSACPYARLRSFRRLGEMREAITALKGLPQREEGAAAGAGRRWGAAVTEWAAAVTESRRRVGRRQNEEYSWARLGRKLAADAEADAAARSLCALGERPHAAPPTPQEEASTSQSPEQAERERLRERRLYAAAVAVGKWGELVAAVQAAAAQERAALAALEQARASAAQNLARVQKLLEQIS